MRINLGTWALTVPVQQARHLQGVAIKNHQYPGYHVLSIVATKFRGWPAARWTFWWQSASAVNPTEVSELLFTAETIDGPQQFIMSISAPLPHITSALKIFHVATNTLKILPF